MDYNCSAKISRFKFHPTKIYKTSPIKFDQVLIKINKKLKNNKILCHVFGIFQLFSLQQNPKSMAIEHYLNKCSSLQNLYRYFCCVQQKVLILFPEPAVNKFSFPRFSHNFWKNFRFTELGKHFFFTEFLSIVISQHLFICRLKSRIVLGTYV